MPAEEILKFLRPDIRQELSKDPEFAFAEELRLRAGRRIMFYANGREYVIDRSVDKGYIGELMLALSAHSLPAYSEEIRNGFFTVGGGVRVGVAGKAVCDKGEIRLIRDFTSVNIRFPRQIKGIHLAISKALAVNGRIPSLLIISAPQHGKTTLLRDLIRAVSSGEAYFPRKVCVIDERNELAGNGYFDLGPRTDVISSCPKAAGMRIALRSLSPEVIATDEIGGDSELDALFEMGNCGVDIMATAHAGGMEELMQRMFFKRLLGAGLIKRIVFLSDTLGRGTVERICTDDGRDMLLSPLPLGPGKRPENAGIRNAV